MVVKLLHPISLIGLILVLSSCGSQRGHRKCDCPEWSETPTSTKPVAEAPQAWHTEP